MTCRNPPLLLWFAIVSAVSALAPPATAQSDEEKISTRLIEEMSANGRALMIVRLRPSGSLVRTSGAVSPAEIARLQDNVLADLKASGLVPRHRFHSVPFILAEGDSRALNAVAAHPLVKSVAADVRVRGQLAESAVQIGADHVIDVLGFDGTGVTLATLDSGIDRDHPDLAGATIAEKAFLHAPDGVTLIQANEAPDGHGHGTQVAGVLTGDGVVAPRGIAPGSKLIVIKVLGDDLTGFLSDVARGLDWLTENVRSFPNLVGVNMSLATVETTAEFPCDSLPQFALVAEAARVLASNGVVSIAASGNGGVLGELPAPACAQNVMSVGASFDASFLRAPDLGTFAEASTGGTFADCVNLNAVVNEIACFTTRSPFLDFLGPGHLIVTSQRGAPVGTSRAVFGTSVAAAHVTATLALMREKNPPPTDPFFLIFEMKSFANRITDFPAPTGTGLTFLLVNARNAVFNSAPPLPLSRAGDSWFFYP